MIEVVMVMERQTFAYPEITGTPSPLKTISSRKIHNSETVPGALTLCQGQRYRAARGTGLQFSSGALPEDTEEAEAR